MCFLNFSVYCFPPCIKGKGKIHPITGHEGPEGDQMYRSSRSLTSALDWVGGQLHAPAALPLGKTRYPLYRRLGGPHGRSGRVRKKNSPPPEFDHLTVRCVASSNTVWAIPTPSLHAYSCLFSIFVQFYRPLPTGGNQFVGNKYRNISCHMYCDVTW